MALFDDRAQAVDQHFALAQDAAPIVADICRRLDGIPLAIELAAARVKILPLKTIAERLDDRFRILAGGERTALPRQQTMHATIEWSYDLLTPKEQWVFERLSVFAGGFDLDAATAVCGGEGLAELDVFDLLASLTDKSLVIADTSGEQGRYRLLESTAAYALEKLCASGEHERMARRHAEYFRLQAEAAGERYGTGSTITWRACVVLDLDNYRATLEWALTKRNDAVLGGAVAGALFRLWRLTGLEVEGRHWVELALSSVSEAEHPAIAALLRLAQSRFFIGNRCYEAAEQAVQLYESVGDLHGAALAQHMRGWSLYQMGRLDEARAATALALAALRACGDMLHAADCFNNLALIEVDCGDLRAGRELFAQALAVAKARGDEIRISRAQHSMAELEFAAGDPERALRLANEALELVSLLNFVEHMAGVYANSAAYRIALGDVVGAREAARAGLYLARQIQSEFRLAHAFQHLALIVALRGDGRCGAQLLGYVDARYDQLRLKRESTEQWGYDKLLATLREALSEREIDKLAAEGATWSEDQAIDEALKV